MKIGTGRYSNMLARFLGGTAALEVAPELSPEISPVFVLEADRPEWEYLKNGRLMAVHIHPAASVANPTTARLRNPAGSNVLAVIEKIQVSTLTTFGVVGAVWVGASTADRTTPMGAEGSRDTRQFATSSSGALKASSDNTAAAGVVLQANNLGLNVVVDFDTAVPIVLMPGFFIDVGCPDTNVDLRISLKWREREIGRYEFGFV